MFNLLRDLFKDFESTLINQQYLMDKNINQILTQKRRSNLENDKRKTNKKKKKMTIQMKSFEFDLIQTATVFTYQIKMQLGSTIEFNFLDIYERLFQNPKILILRKFTLKLKTLNKQILRCHLLGIMLLMISN